MTILELFEKNNLLWTSPRWIYWLKEGTTEREFRNIRTAMRRLATQGKLHRWDGKDLYRLVVKDETEPSV